jgi:hypothetical protein
VSPAYRWRQRLAHLSRIARLYGVPTGIEAIIGQVIGGTDPKKRLVLVLTCYLDDSATTKDRPVITMAGYLGAFHPWIAYEAKAKELFAQAGISVLHAKDFHDNDGEFKGWKKRKKEKFVEGLFLALGRYAEFGLSFSMDKAAFQKAKRMKGADPRESAYGHCFRQLLDQLIRSNIVLGANKKHGWKLSIVVECGNKNNVNVRNIFNMMKIRIPGLLGSISFADKKSTRALQTADFLAFHSRRYIDDCNAAGRNIRPPPILKAMLSRLHHTGYISHDYCPKGQVTSAPVGSASSWRKGEWRLI